MCKEMFKLGFWYYLLNIPVNLLLSSYKVQDRMMLVNTMSFFETAVIGVLAMLLVPVLDIRAVWLSGLISDAISLSLIFMACSIGYYNNAGNNTLMIKL